MPAGTRATETSVRASIKGANYLRHPSWTRPSQHVGAGDSGGGDSLASGESIGAVELLERTRDKLSAALGSEHPIVSDALYELAIMRWDLGEHTVALDLLNQSIGIREAAFAPAHSELTSAIEQRDKWLAID